MSTELLSNYLGGQWQAGQGSGTPLLDPVLGTELVRVDATGLDLAAARNSRALKESVWRVQLMASRADSFM